MKPNVPARSFTEAVFNVQSDISMVGGRLLRSSFPNATSSVANATSSSSNPVVVTIDVCVDGMPMKLDVLVQGAPYEA